MKRIFDLPKQTIEGQILVLAEFEQREYGVIEIHRFDSLELDEQSDERMSFNIRGGKMWSGAQEPAQWGEHQRKRSPSDRGSTKTYIPYGFGSLNIIPTSNGSRFLSLKSAWPGGVSTSADEGSDEIAVIVSNLSELDEYLDVVLSKIGVPPTDISNIKSEILHVLS